MAKLTKPVLFYLFPIMAILLIYSPATHPYHIEVLPTITVGGTYHDNVNLDRENKKSGYTTTVSPGIALNIDSGKSGLNLDYSATWVKYYKYSGNDTIRQNGSLHFWKGFGKNLRFDLYESYLKSDQTTEETFDEPFGETPRFRNTRDTYQRNDASASLDYKFGPRDNILIGYNYSLLDNDDPSLDDNTSRGPFGEFSYWFNVNNGIELSYLFERVEYNRKDGSPTSTDLESHNASARYLHSFNRRTTAYLYYGLTETDYKGPGDDHVVHDGGIGVDHNLSKNTTLSLEVGYYRKINDTADNEWGGTYAASLSHRFRRGSISLNAIKSWDDDYLSPSPQGFTNYWQVGGTLAYTLLENLGARAGISYRNDKYETGIESHTYQGTCGLRLDFLRWYYADLGYTYLNRKGDDPDNEYTDNAIILTFSASRPFRWGKR